MCHGPVPAIVPLRLQTGKTWQNFESFTNANARTLILKGTVFRSTGSWYTVKLETGSMMECRIKGKLRTRGLRSTNPVAVGDVVEIEPEPDTDTGLIKDIVERENYIIRKSTNLSKREHIIAANIDQALLLATMAQPATSTGFMDRFLVTAEAYHIPVVIVFNKADVYNAAETEMLEALVATYTEIGYRCLVTSATEKQGLQEVTELLADKVTLLSGHSGVGKSTLINAIEPSLDLATASISEWSSKGKHTTTFAEMFELSFGGCVIDSPGIKGFGIINFEKEELAHRFPEMRERLHDCKFSNCVHINEPGCAVQAAVEEGEIAEFRYINYLTMYEEDEDEKYRVKKV